MANHCEVKTKRKMDAGSIYRMLCNLSKALLRDCLTIEYEDRCPPAYGTGQWNLEYVSSVDKKPYAFRVCWLNSPNSFEIRHGGGTHFAWWVDRLITNEVAVQFEGRIFDDAFGEDDYPGVEGVPNQYDDFRKEMRKDISRVRSGYRKAMASSVFEGCPPEFKVFETSILD